ncbi:hypothetical protein N7G274_002396 [Stereocaulon virgatum]|uniref:Uncharacterized protein n=1 Tax=Stereocaulon virgatum TaxID=373712 RepID=A0ABR4AHQ9_9LECA
MISVNMHVECLTYGSTLLESLYSVPTRPSNFTENMMDMGFAVTRTPATDFLCGLEALAISLKAIRKLYGHKMSPSVEDLKLTLCSTLYAMMISDNLSNSPELNSTNSLTCEQLSVILQIKSIELGVNYRLGITQIDATKTTLILLGEEGQTVWIHKSVGQYNDGEAHQRMGGSLVWVLTPFRTTARAFFSKTRVSPSFDTHRSLCDSCSPIS